jgi:hypothetical protein
MNFSKATIVSGKWKAGNAIFRTLQTGEMMVLPLSQSAHFRNKPATITTRDKKRTVNKTNKLGETSNWSFLDSV